MHCHIIQFLIKLSHDICIYRFKCNVTKFENSHFFYLPCMAYWYIGKTTEVHSRFVADCYFVTSGYHCLGIDGKWLTISITFCSTVCEKGALFTNFCIC